jgi:hypothetical protein
MQHYIITSKDCQTPLFEGRFYSFKACLEQAVKDRIRLDNIDLSHKNLSNANLDNALMPSADFTGTNLTGANLSECTLTGARFSGSSLYNTFFCYSDLSGCDFEDASFGATDIHGAILADTRFSTLSCFSLDFSRAQHMRGCLYINPDGTSCRMSAPPVVIRGLRHDPIVFMDDQVKAGRNIFDSARLGSRFSRLSMRDIEHTISALRTPPASRGSGTQ